MQDLTPEQMTTKINEAIARVEDLGYTKKEATAMIEKALVLVAQGKKLITDVIKF